MLGQALVVSLVESLVKHMDMTEDADSSNHGGAAEKRSISLPRHAWLQRLCFAR